MADLKDEMLVTDKRAIHPRKVALHLMYKATPDADFFSEQSECYCTAHPGSHYHVVGSISTRVISPRTAKRASRKAKAS